MATGLFTEMASPTASLREASCCLIFIITGLTDSFCALGLAQAVASCVRSGTRSYREAHSCDMYICEP